MKITPDYHILINIKDNVKQKKQVIITFLTEEEELELDNIKDIKVIKINRGNRCFEITQNDILCYGLIDLNDENDVNIISRLKFLSHLDVVGKHIFANYDYDNHTCSSPTKKPKWTETFNPLVLFKYGHGCINKPKHVLLFNRIIK